MVCKLSLLGFLTQGILALAAPANLLARKDNPIFYATSELPRLNGCLGRLQVIRATAPPIEPQAALPNLDRNGEINRLLPYGLFSISPSATNPSSYEIQNFSPLSKALHCGLNYANIFSCQYSASEVLLAPEITAADNLVTYKGIDRWGMTPPTGSIPFSQLQLRQDGQYHLVCVPRLELSPMERYTIEQRKAAREPVVQENKELPAFSMSY